ncbi:zinc finger CCCH-type with G patch domain-containing protein [Octopus sinensis]|uniref:Zinc finger CCCH-type with G patch domain-containing protein n=1 Tax=Octopus sinensis TaxID=2607531 RepID=A0A6P7S6R3_9MOLL|nr:zinc finger CCCH-type with G patch domain-containing protein [Octopus sinensis]
MLFLDYSFRELLALRKSQILRHLESTSVEKSPSPVTSTAFSSDTHVNQTQTSKDVDLDAEYEAFKASLSSDVNFKKLSPDISVGSSSSRLQSEDSSSDVRGEIADRKEKFHDEETDKRENGDDDDDDDEEEEEEEDEAEEEEENRKLTERLQELVGTKCRVTYNTSWAMYGCHNALITDVLPFDSMSPAKVEVMFCNPMHRTMVPCQYFLNGKCRFSDEKCNFSHGYVANLDDIRPYHEPDYSSLQIGGKCLARYTDGLWCNVKIEGIEEDGRFVVAFEGHNDVLVVGSDEIMPAAVTDEEFPCESDTEEDDDDDHYGSQPTASLMYVAPKTTVALGEWETHTKGIGSQLMAKMGYIAGQGLGRNNEGKIEPIPIEVLPAGKSLDTVMKLKEEASNKNLFNVLNNEKAKKSLEKKNKAAYNKIEPTNVFDFINNKLDKKTDHVGKHFQNAGKTKNKVKSTNTESCKEISLQELSKKSDRTLNIQLMKTEGELRRVDREITKLRQSISRNEDRNQSVVKSVQEKLSNLETYKSQLKASEKAIGQQKNQRHAHKKLTIF